MEICFLMVTIVTTWLNACSSEIKYRFFFLVLLLHLDGFGASCRVLAMRHQLYRCQPSVQYYGARVLS